MSQITSGFRAVLSVPSFYDLSQDVLGATRLRARLVKEFVRPYPGLRLLDMGCGTGALLPFLPGVEYVGVDLSERYIEAAKQRHGDRGRFHVGRVEQAGWLRGQSFDVVAALGVLHHLEDGEAHSLLQLSGSLVVPGGRMVTIDPCLEAGQSPVARFLAGRDRGQNVRTRVEYLRLLEPHFESVQGTVRHDLLRIPYTHFIAESRAATQNGASRTGE